MSGSRGRISYGTTPSGSGYTAAYRRTRGRGGRPGRDQLIALNIAGEWLSVKDMRKTRKEALTKIGIVGQSAARLNAPKRSGTGAGAIDYVVRVNRVKIRVNPKDEGWYMRLVEIGHKVVVVPYWVRRQRRSKKTGQLYNVAGRGKNAYKKVRIVVGTARPRPFFMPAMNASLGEMGEIALNTFGDSVKIERLDL